MSDYSGTRFYTRTFSSPYYLGSAYTFQGFIYLPGTYTSSGGTTTGGTSGSLGGVIGGTSAQAPTGDYISELPTPDELEDKANSGSGLEWWGDIVKVVLCILLVIIGVVMLVLGVKGTIIDSGAIGKLIGGIM